MRLVFMGTPAFAATCLTRLLQTEHSILCVVTRPDKPAGRGHKLQQSAVKDVACREGLEVLAPTKASDAAFAERLRELAPDLGVVVAYGRLLPRTIIDIPRLGCINAHASLLPKLRGAAPIERAILQGFDHTGVTIMRIDERMDAGDVMLSGALAIDPGMDAGALRERLSELAAHLLVRAVDELAAGDVAFEPQDEQLATYAPPLRKEEARIDWSQPAEYVERQIRAFHPKPGAFTTDAGRRLKILAARVHKHVGAAEPGRLSLRDDGAAAVDCGDASLVLDLVQPEGRRAMRAVDYLRGCAEPLPRQLGGLLDERRSG